MLDRPDPATAAALARLYDLDLLDDPGDLDLYLALAARADGPILELAAGTGRLAVPLALAGHTVYGRRSRSGDARPGTTAGQRRRRGHGPPPFRRGGPGRRSTARRRLLPPRVHRAEFRSSCSTRARPSDARCRSSPTTWRPAASPWSTSGCRTRTTCTGSTDGSSLAWLRTDPETGECHQGQLGPARRGDRDGRPDHDLRGGGAGIAARPLGAHGSPAADRRGRAGRVRRGRGPRRRAAGRRLRSRPVRTRGDRIVLIAERR